MSDCQRYVIKQKNDKLLSLYGAGFRLSHFRLQRDDLFSCRLACFHSDSKQPIIELNDVASM